MIIINTCLIAREDSPCHGPADEDATCQDAHQAPRPLEQAITRCHPVCYHQKSANQRTAGFSNNSASSFFQIYALEEIIRDSYHWFRGVGWKKKYPGFFPPFHVALLWKITYFVGMVSSSSVLWIMLHDPMLLHHEDGPPCSCKCAQHRGPAITKVIENRLQ